MATIPPDRKTLQNYLQGKLSDAKSDQIAQLVADDPDLQSRLEELDRSGDTFIDLLRQDKEDTPTEGYSEYGPALDKAKKLFDPQSGEFFLQEQEDPTANTLGEYKLIERIGQGGMGVVFKARHTKLGRTVAVKVICDARATDERAIARFEREIKAIGQLDHPSIVHAHDAREIDGRSVLVMEYVDGLDLGRLIRRHGPISTADACELIRQAAVGLQAAHELGLVHRDIKPSNLMLDREGNVKILDLGLAREAVDLGELQREISMSFDLTQTGQAMGTADYMAPEQATHPGMVDIRADIYSMGCTLFKLLTGRAPYHEEMTFDKLSAHAEVPLPPTPDLPEGLRKILDRMTAKDPADRFSTPEEVAKALEPFCSGHDLPDLLARAESQTAPAQILHRPAAGGRFRRIAMLLLLMFFFGGLGLAGGIILTIEHNGKKTSFEFPDNTEKVKVDKDGNVTAHLDGTPGTSPAKTTPAAESPEGFISYDWSEEDVKLGLENIQKKPYAVMTFLPHDDTHGYSNGYFSIPSWVNQNTETIHFQAVTLGSKSARWDKYFHVKSPTTILFKNGKEVFREKGSILSDEVERKILAYLPPLRITAMSFSGSDGQSGYGLTIQNQAGQSKRWAGKTLRVIWPKNVKVSFLTDGYKNLKEQSVEWPIAKDTFADQDLSYQIQLLAVSPQGDAEFRAELLDAKGKVESVTSIKRNIQTSAAPIVTPPAKTDEEIPPIEWTEKGFRDGLDAIQSRSYAVVSFLPRGDCIYLYPEQIKQYFDVMGYLAVELGSKSALWEKHFHVKTPTTIFLKDGKEIFREKGDINSESVVQKITSHLPPIRFDTNAEPVTNMGISLKVDNRSGQSKRCAGKTLRLSWPEDLRLDVFTKGLRNRKKGSVEWFIPEDTFANQKLHYEARVYAWRPQGQAEFRAEILDKKGDVEWSCVIKKDIQPISNLTGENLVKAKEPVQSDQRKIGELLGEWEIVSALDPSTKKTIPVNGSKLKLRFTKSYMEWIDGKESNPVFMYETDLTTKPKRITLGTIINGKEQHLYGIYKIEGDQLTIATGPDHFPADFTKNAMRLKRVKPVEQPGPPYDTAKNDESDRQRLIGTRWKLHLLVNNGKTVTGVSDPHYQSQELVFEKDYIKYFEAGKEKSKVPFVINSTSKRISWPHGIKYSDYRLNKNMLIIHVIDPKHPEMGLVPVPQYAYYWEKITPKAPDSTSPYPATPVPYGTHGYQNTPYPTTPPTANERVAYTKPLEVRFKKLKIEDSKAEKATLLLDLRVSPPGFGKREVRISLPEPLQFKDFAGKRTLTKTFSPDPSKHSSYSLVSMPELEIPIKGWKGKIQVSISNESGEGIPSTSITHADLKKDIDAALSRTYSEEKDLAWIEKSPYAVVTFQKPQPLHIASTSLRNDWIRLPDQEKLVSGKIESLWLNLPVTPKLQKRFKITVPTTLFLRNGKEVFRVDGPFSLGKPFLEKLDSHLPPIQIGIGKGPQENNDRYLVVSNRAGQIQRCAGKTLRVTWPESVKIDTLTDGYRNLKKQSVEWSISNDVFEAQKLHYQIDFHIVAFRKNAEFRAELLDPQGKVEWTTAIQRDLVTGPAPMVIPTDPKKQELQKLYGTWKVVSMRDGGKVKKLPAGKEMQVTFGKRWVTVSGSGPGHSGPMEQNFVIAPGRDGKMEDTSFVIDVTTDPKRISWPQRMKNYSIYKIEGDRLTLCWAERPKDGHPTKFVSEKNSPNDRLMVLERVKTTGTGTKWQMPSATVNRKTQLTGVWKLVERPNAKGCLLLTSEKEKMPEVSVTMTDKTLYLRGREIVNRQLSYEVSPDGKQINLVDGRDQVYRGVMQIEKDGKRLILVVGDKKRPAGIWDYFGPDYDRLVFEKTKTKPDLAAFTDKELFEKKWFLMNKKPSYLENMSSEQEATTPKNSLAALFIISDDNKPNSSNRVRDLLLGMGSMDFSPNGTCVIDHASSCYLIELWPQQWTCMIDATATPKQIDLVSEKGTVLKGIYKIKDHHLSICFTSKNLSRPRKFPESHNDDLIEFELAYPPSPTPKSATVLATHHGIFFDGKRLEGSYDFHKIYEDSSPLIRQIRKNPQLRIVLESYCYDIDLICYRRQLLDAGAKSVEIKLIEPCEFPYGFSPLEYELLKDLPKIVNNDAEDLKKLDQKTPLMLSCKTEAKKEKGQVSHMVPLRSMLSIHKVSMQENGTLHIQLHPGSTEAFKKLKGKPSDRVAIWIRHGGLVFATPTLESLRKGAFDIDLKFSNAERKILLDMLGEQLTEIDKMHGGIM